jgi:pimeloyl-ACP methyl ester carboxylesterase
MASRTNRHQILASKANTQFTLTNPRVSSTIVEELHTLLQNADIHSPYILVGHSFGGINVRLYERKFPDDVA